MPENPANPNDPTKPKPAGPKRRPNDKKELYGLIFPGLMDQVEIELYCIRKGGSWKGKQGQTLGMGEFFHYKRLMQILWPKDAHHRWSDLMLAETLRSTILAVLGPRDSGKTHCALTRYALTDYFAFPHNTLILVSSTDVRGLELRVWGDMKNMFKQAKDRYPSLPGHLLDSKHAICTDNLIEGETRDLRKGIICWVRDSMIDTPSGQRPIQDIRVGDAVYNASGVGRVYETQCSIAKQIVRVTLNDGRKFDCTPEHPFFTQRGWVDAVGLKTCDRVFSADETVRLLRRTTRTRIPESKTLFSHLPGQASGPSMRFLQKGFQASKTKSYPSEGVGEVLQHNMCEPLGSSIQTSFHQKDRFHLPELWKEDEECAFWQTILLSSLQESSKESEMQELRGEVCFNQTLRDKTEEEVLRSILQSELDWTKTVSGQRQDHQNRTHGCKAVPSSKDSPQDLHRQNISWEDQALVRVGHSVPKVEARRGSRWVETLNEIIQNSGRKTHQRTEQAWVESVEILSPEGDERFDVSEGGYRVYNFSVDTHPSYSVNGVVVHNCIPCMSSGGSWQGLGKYVGIKQKRRRLLGDESQLMKAGYLDALANLNSGTGEGHDFKGVFVGNPLGIGDPLDRISEPKNGWGTEGEIKKTTVWDNRFENGRTLNLVGEDSPNFDYPQDQPPKYPWMINAKSIEAVASFYGKDSLQYWSQCKGVRKAGLNGRRVFTRNLAIKFKAFEEVAWKNDQQVRIYAVDAAYGEVGGDRCVGGWGSFGRDVNGDMILHMNPHVIIPVKAGTDISAEDQIAEFVRQDCISLKIPAENVFYDATGRGSLGTAFARIWSPFVNPVEFGGRATNRQVSAELMIVDPETQKMRPKTCYEHFSKFVTELWFMARYVIESGQMRGLTEEVLEDGSTREWKMVTGNRIEIEAKIDTKERMGRSPDLMDWWVTVVEGARQKGFQLRALAAPQKPQNDDWKDTLRKKAMDLHHAGALNYSA